MSRYPPIAYRQLFPEGTRDGLPPFDPAEDGDHYRPEPCFFEWWYFDAVLDDGAVLVAILHSSLYNASDHRPTLDMRYYPPRGGSIVATARFDRSAYRAAMDRCCIELGRNLVVDDGDCYRVELCQGALELALSFWPELPGCRVGTGHLLADPASGRFFDWVVPLPRARVEGILTLAGRRMQVAGTGYHDHNWGNVYLPAAFSRWTWGRVVAGDWALVFGDVVGRGTSPEHVTPFLLSGNNAVLLSTDHIHIRGEEPAREPRTGARYYRRLHVTTQEGPAVDLDLTTQRLIESLDFAAPYPPLGTRRCLRGGAETAFYLSRKLPWAHRPVARLLGKGSYLRWGTDFRLCLRDHGFENAGQALCEIMVL